MNKVIHESLSADTSGYTYNQVYCGTGGTITLNGVSVILVPSTVLDIVVKTITGAAGIYVIGIKKISLPPQIL